jgi:hypothetical protein
MILGRLYAVSFENVAVTAAQDLFDIAPATRPFCSAAKTRIVVTMLTTPADSVTMNGTLIVEEI